MDPRLLRAYEAELKHVRALGGEFAQAFPKIAGRLGLDAFECADPYVERMIESFAFLTARVQLGLDAAFPEFTQQLIELLYPGYLAPTPSMTVVQMQPNLREGNLAQGHVVPRGAALRSQFGAHQTACEYRSAHDVTLWPVALTEAKYCSSLGELIDLARVRLPHVKAGLRIVLETSGGRSFDQLPLESLPLFLRGGMEPGARLYEQLLSASVGLIIKPVGRPVEPRDVVSGRVVTPLGFEDQQALLPCGARGFQGHRLLHEYFAFPERFMFVELRQLRAALSRCNTQKVELIVLFKTAEPRLEGKLTHAHLALYCTPAVNLFARPIDRIHVTERDHEYHVVPDRTRPLDFEVHSVTAVTGYGPSGSGARDLMPMYTPAAGPSQQRPDCFSVRRRVHARGQERNASRSAAYVPSEVFVMLGATSDGLPLQQLGISALCTNRSLPLQLDLGRGQTDFTEQGGAPVEAIRCVAGPTAPHNSLGQSELAWALLSHLSLDYTALTRADADDGAAGLRQLLSLYANLSEPSTQRQLQGLLQLQARSVVRPLPFPGPMTFGRGTELTLSCDESAFEGGSAFLLGAVLERFLAKYASINAFTETVLRTSQRGEVMRWPTTAGRRNAV